MPIAINNNNNNNSRQGRPSTMSMLPEEIMQHILTFIDNPLEVLRISLVSREWYNAQDNQYLWQCVYGSIISRISSNSTYNEEQEDRTMSREWKHEQHLINQCIKRNIRIDSNILRVFSIYRYLLLREQELQQLKKTRLQLKSEQLLSIRFERQFIESQDNKKPPALDMLRVSILPVLQPIISFMLYLVDHFVMRRSLTATTWISNNASMQQNGNNGQEERENNNATTTATDTTSSSNSSNALAALISMLSERLTLRTSLDVLDVQLLINERAKRSRIQEELASLEAEIQQRSASLESRILRAKTKHARALNQLQDTLLDSSSSPNKKHERNGFCSIS